MKWYSKPRGMTADLPTLTFPQRFNSLHATRTGVSSSSGIGHLELRSDFLSQGCLTLDALVLMLTVLCGFQFGFLRLRFQDKREKNLRTMKGLLRQKTYQLALSKISSPLDPSYELRELKYEMTILLSA